RCTWEFPCTPDARNDNCKNYRSRQASRTWVRLKAARPMRGTLRAPGTMASSSGSVMAALNVSTPTMLHTIRNASQSARRIEVTSKPGHRKRSPHGRQARIGGTDAWHGVRYEGEA